MTPEGEIIDGKEADTARGLTESEEEEILEESESDGFGSFDYEYEHWCAIPSCRIRFREQSPGEQQ